MRPINPLVAILLAAASAPAAATFHETSIREVYVGPAGDPNAQYVELQAYASGQNFVQGKSLTFYGPTGTLLGTVTFSADKGNGNNQAHLLIATTQAVTKFSVAADLSMTALLDPAGGKVCFENVDCFSWGSYSGTGTTPSPSGTPFNVAGGLTADTAVRRDITGGASATMLDVSDDTNDSAADFDFAASPNPLNNASGAAPGGGYGGGSGSGGGGGGGAVPPLVSLLLLAAWGLRRRR